MLEGMNQYLFFQSFSLLTMKCNSVDERSYETPDHHISQRNLQLKNLATGMHPPPDPHSEFEKKLI